MTIRRDDDKNYWLNSQKTTGREFWDGLRTIARSGSPEGPGALPAVRVCACTQKWDKTDRTTSNVRDMRRWM
jgi:hypothetical protein